jgi:hypothetical protein
MNNRIMPREAGAQRGHVGRHQVRQLEFFCFGRGRSRELGKQQLVVGQSQFAG